MTRARLTTVRVRGFKSFAKDTELVFGVGLTAVIGPNGSGKSNLAEAVRWVLGEQSVKQLRGKERRDVIFTGSGSGGQAQRAVVTLTFDNSEGWFPLEASEVEIRRELTRGGESTYALNGESIRLLDLQQMLAEASIGAKSFTVISQGMVDHYLTASPEKRRELFDEATGIKGLQMQLQQAERKLEQARGHAQEVRGVLEELGPRLTVLERQMAREQEREQLAEEFEQKQTIWLRQEWQRRVRRQEQAVAGYESLQAEIAHARSDREAAERSLLATARKHGPQEREREQLWAAEEAYKRQREAYERRARERRELQHVVESTRKQRHEAEEALAAARERVENTGELGTWRARLGECRELLQTWLDGQQQDRERVRSVVEQVDELLGAEGEQGMATRMWELLETLEQPLRAVSRLQAQEEEREEQLAGLPELPEPKDERVRALRESVRQQSAKEENSASSALAAAREREIAAEREGSAAQAAVQQSHRELHELEQMVMRERGSAFWERIQADAGAATEATVKVADLRALEGRMSQLGELDPLVKKEYEEARARQAELAGQLRDIEATEANIRQLQTELSERLREQFQSQFLVIARAFSEYFARLFGGGQARLTATEAGIEITVAPPGKRARHMALLSGGERALTALALLLAILEAGEPPFIVLDEVDAALDEANSRRLASIIREKSEHTQCVMITHNRETMSQAERLYGVTMQESGVSKVYSVSLRDLPVEVAQTIAV